MYRLVLMLLLTGMLAACGSKPEKAAEPAKAPPAAEPEEAPAAEPEEAAKAEPEEPSEEDKHALGLARFGLKTLGGTLKQRLSTAMADGGPASAVSMCSTQAAAMTDNTAVNTGVMVGRSSLRLRNPDNEAPDWVLEWLEAQGERTLGPEVTGIERVQTNVDGERVARVLKPLAVDGLCLTCHGPVEGIPAEVKRVLAEKYPEDKAVGYAVGDLRGAIWAEAMVAERPEP